MRKKFKIILVVAAALLLAVFAAYKYIMTGGARDVSSEAAAFSVTAKEVSSAFASDEAGASKKYLDKPIEIRGNVSRTATGVVVVDEKAVCILKDSTITATTGKAITLKGRVVGYDSLMEELKLDQCTITNQ